MDPAQPAVAAPPVATESAAPVHRTHVRSCLDVPVAAGVLLLAAALASFAASNADLWLHLATGRLVAHRQYSFGVDPFSAVEGAQWINHAWLFDFVLFVLFRFGGGTVLVATKAFLVTVLAGILLAIRRPRDRGYPIGALAPAAMTTLVLLAISPFLILRSSIASYLFFALLLLILHRWPLATPQSGTRRRSRRSPPPVLWPAGKRWYFPAVVGLLFLLWVNVDGGFVFGLLLLALWTIGAILQRALPVGEAVVARSRRRAIASRRRRRSATAAALAAGQIVPRHEQSSRRTHRPNRGSDDPGEPSHSPASLGIALAAAVVASCLNPYFLKAFRLPTEIAALTLPAELRADRFFEGYLRPALGANHVLSIGPFAAGALYMLLALGLASFAINIGGWRWRRIAAWTVFALLGIMFARLSPYFALVAGPTIVLNVQAYVSRRRSALVERPNIRAEHLRRFFAMAGRASLLICLVLLLVLAWPGWLAADARNPAPSRRVAWRVNADPTMERLARRLNDWHETGRLKAHRSYGFPVHPEMGFSSYCAWFCPAERSLFDSRLTSPPAVIADCLAMQRYFLALNGIGELGPPPNTLFRKYGITHVALNGDDTLFPPPLLLGLGPALFSEPSRWPVWAIEGRGVICGWNDPQGQSSAAFAAMELNPFQLAVGDAATPVPPPPESLAAPTPPTLWDRLLSSPAPVPAEAYEAGLWLAYRDAHLWLGYRNARIERGNLATFLARRIARLGRSIPLGVPDLAGQLFDEFPNDRYATQLQNGWQAAWLQSTDGRIARAATVLAIRAARRAIAANPNPSESFSRLAQAYAGFNSDPALHLYEQLTACRMTLARMPPVAVRPSVLLEEKNLWEILLNLYQQKTLLPGTQIRPDDLILEAYKEFLDRLGRVDPALMGMTPKQLESVLQRHKPALQQLRDRVDKQRDEYETDARNDRPVVRAARACAYGQIREGLAVLQGMDKKDLDAPALQLWITLLLLVGDADEARRVLAEVPTDQLPAIAQMQFRLQSVQANAAVGDYATAIEQAAALTNMFQGLPDMHKALGTLLTDLVVPDAAPGHPFTRIATMPLWAGMRDSQGQPGTVGNRVLIGDWWILNAAVADLQQYGDWLVRQGMLSLEQGDAIQARRRLTEAVGPSAPPLHFNDRRLGQNWLQLWD